jgi:hypothetical protein
MSASSEQNAAWNEALRQGHVHRMAGGLPLCWRITLGLCGSALIVIGWLERRESHPWKSWWDLVLGCLGLAMLLTDLRRSTRQAIITESDLWIEPTWGRPWRIPWRQVVRVVRDQPARALRSAGRLEIHLEGRRRPLVLGPPLTGEVLDLLYLELLGHAEIQPVVSPPPEPKPGELWVEDTRHEVWARAAAPAEPL